MRFVHVSDLHIGISSYNNNKYSRLKDWENAFNYLIEYVKKESIPYVIIAGDLYHKNIPSIEEIVIANQCLLSLSKITKKIFLVAGNHDINSLSVKRHILESKTIENLIVIDKTQVYEFDDLDFNILHYHYLDLKPVEYNLDKKHIVTFHGTVQGSKDDIGNESLHFHLSKDFLLQTNPIYVALGHIHKRQNLNTENNPVSYSGSFIQTSFTEKNVNKGFLDIQIINQDVISKFVKTPYIEYISINSLEELLTINIADKITRIEFEITPEQKELYSDILNSAYFVSYNFVKKKSTTEPEESIQDSEADLDTIDFDNLADKYLSKDDKEFMNQIMTEKG